MNLKKTYYGVDHPSKHRIFLMNTFTCCLLLFAIVFFIPFAPSREWVILSERIAMSLSVLLTGYIMYILYPAKSIRWPGKVLYAIKGIFFLGAITLALIVDITYGVGVLMTLYSSEPFELKSEISTEYKLSSGEKGDSCRYRLKGGLIKQTWTSHLCTSRENFNKMKNAYNIIYFGDKSWFGRIISGVKFNT